MTDRELMIALAHSGSKRNLIASLDKLLTKLRIIEAAKACVESSAAPATLVEEDVKFLSTSRFALSIWEEDTRMTGKRGRGRFPRTASWKQQNRAAQWDR